MSEVGNTLHHNIHQDCRKPVGGGVGTDKTDQDQPQAGKGEKRKLPSYSGCKCITSFSWPTALLKPVVIGFDSFDHGIDWISKKTVISKFNSRFSEISTIMEKHWKESLNIESNIIVELSLKWKINERMEKSSNCIWVGFLHRNPTTEVSRAPSVHLAHTTTFQLYMREVFG